jgi:predicted transcriptional regulator
MKNKDVGFLVVGISFIMAIMVFLFNKIVKDIGGLTCSHGSSCTMYSSLSIQTWISLSVVGLLFIIGLFLIFSKEEKEIVIKRIKERIETKRKPLNYSKLDKEEKIIIKILEDEKGSMFQADLVDKSNFDKVKVTRILDRLEGRQIIERKRRGMTNIVILK